MREVIANIATVIVASAAAAIAAVVVVREVRDDREGASLSFRAVPNWETIAATGRTLGPASASIRIVEFADFQCTYCREAANSLSVMRARHANVSIVYRHFPLSAIHPHARSAANAAECAGAQGRFEEYHNVLYDRQETIGVTDWSDFAVLAGVPDLPTFKRCVETEAFAGTVEADLREGLRVGVSGTPTFIFNGRMLTGAVAVGQLAGSISKIASRERRAR